MNTAARYLISVLTFTLTAAHGQVVEKWVQRYNAAGNSYDYATATTVDSAGNIVVTGYSPNANGNVDYYTAKYAAANGTLLWEKRHNGTFNGSDTAHSVAVDSTGNVVVTGSSVGSGSGWDYCTVKYAAADGALLWEKRYNGTGNGADLASNVAVDSAGNVAVTGESIGSGGSYDYYTAKYAAANGALLWEKRYNGSGNSDDQSLSVAVDSEGNVAVTGRSRNASGNDDYYTAKYAAANGALLWEKRYNGTGNNEDMAYSVAVDSAGNVVVTGESTGSGGNYDYYTAKYAAVDGALLWEKRYNGPGNNEDMALSVAVDSEGNVAVTGRSRNASSNDDYYTAKYAGANGALLWEKRYNGPGNSDDQALSVAMDSGGNVVVTGNSVGISINADYYTAKYAAADGALLWEQRYNGPDNEEDRMDLIFPYACKLALTADGGAAVTGQSSNGFNEDYATVRYGPPPLPVVTITAITGLTSSSATLNGTVNPNGLATTAQFQFGLTTSYGSTFSVTLSPNNGSSAQTVSAFPSGLTPGTTYHYRLRATNSAGTSNTSDGTFTTLLAPPTLTIGGTTQITQTTATLNGSVNPNGGATTASFDYGPTTSFGSTASVTLSPNNGTAPQSVSANIAGLAADTQYYYRLTATNSAGTSTTTNGTFATLFLPPVVTTSPPTSIVGHSATLNGSVNPNGGPTTASFEYGPTIAFGSTVGVTLSPNNGSSTQNVSAGISGLAADTQYYYRLTATNAGGTSTTSIGTFATLLPQPVVAVTAATDVTPNRGTLNGTINPNGLATTGQFQVGPTTSYGSTFPVTLSPNNGTSAQSVNAFPSALVPGTTYHYRLSATSASGTTHSADATFRTLDPGGSSPLSGWPVMAVAGSGVGDDEGRGVAVDAAGNVAVVGSKTNASGDLYVAKYSPAGALVWQVTNDNPIHHGLDIGRAVAFDSSGNVVVTGQTYNGVNGSGGTEIDVYTAKYAAADGALLWQRTYNNLLASSDDRGFCVLVDGSDNVIVGGYSFRGSGNQDYFTAKYAGATGAVIWEAAYNGPVNGTDIATSMALDSSGNVVVTGYSANASSNMDFLTVKYAGTNGSQVWEHRYNGPALQNDYAYGVNVDTSGDVFVVGESRNAGGNDDAKLIKLSSAAGTLLWEASHGGAAGGNDSANRVVVNSVGDVFVSGSTTGVGTSWDYLTAKYSGSTGAQQWLRTYDGPASNADLSSALLLAPNGDVFVTGYSRGADDDYLTLRYRGSDGYPLHSARSQGPGLGGDYPSSSFRGTALLPNGWPVVTGKALGLSGEFEIMTVAYGGPPSTGPVGGTMALLPVSPVNASAALTVSFAGWADASLPLTYAVLVDDVIVSAQGAAASRSFTGPVTPGAHTLKGRIYDALNNLTEVTQAFTVAPPLPTSGLVAEFGFAGNANDGIGSLHGMAHNGAALTTDRFGRAGHAYAFDGANDYLEMPDGNALSLTTTGELSLSVWVRPDGTSLDGSNQLLFNAKEGTGYVHWMGKGVPSQHEWAMRIYSADNTDVPNRANRMSCYLFNPAGGTGTGSFVQEALTPGQWIHYVVVMSQSGGTMTWYKNGVQKDQDSFAGSITPANGTAPLRIGTRDFNSFFAGAVDDIRIYNRVLTPTEIGHLHLEAVPLQAAWRQTWFGTTGNVSNASDAFDFDQDGLVNLMEWACGLNPTTASTLPITSVRNGAVFEFTYTRSVAALNAGAIFTVEWSETLPGLSWSTSGVTEQILSDNGTVQQVKALVPAGAAGHRFVHLRVTSPP